MASRKDKELQAGKGDSLCKKAVQASEKKTQKKARIPKVLPMTLDEKFEQWLDVAQYDLKVAKSMLKAGHWLYVAFMCQQAIEKLAKGLYTLYLDENPPHTHNINLIFVPFRGRLPVKELQSKEDFFADLSSYYLNNRYPKAKETLSKRISKAEAAEIYSQAKETFEWLLTLKP
jgi:HEPN domain-containing protein